VHRWKALQDKPSVALRHNSYRFMQVADSSSAHSF
jgi:hypothetical protein